VCHGAGDPAAARRFTPPSRPRRRPIVQRCPTEGGGDSPVRRPGADGCCASPVAIPRTLPPAVLGAPLPAMLIVRRRRWGPVIGREQRRVRLVIAPPHAPAGDPTPITQVKVRTRAKSRVSIETLELRLLSQECDFPGINIPTLHSIHITQSRYITVCSGPAHPPQMCPIP